MNLFSFGLNEAQYVDRFASYSDYERFRKMNVKSNVNMIVDKFTPFNKAKRLKQPTKTIIAMDNSNIDGIDGSFSIGSDSKGGNRSVVVNTSNVVEEMKNIYEEKQFEHFEQQMRYSYGTLENITRVATFMSPKTKIEDISDSYLNKIEKAANMMKAAMHGYLPDYDGNSMSIEKPVGFSSSVDEFVNDLVFGCSDSLVTDSIRKLKKTAADYNLALEHLRDLIYEDVSADRHKVEYDDDKAFVPSLKVHQRMDDNPAQNGAKDACSVGGGHVDYDDSPSFSESETAKDNKFELNNDTMEYPEHTHNEDKYFFNKRDYEGRNFERFEPLVDALYESLSGRLGRKKSFSPDKRLNKRAVAADLSDKIYISRNPIDGKQLNVNLMLDTSGSMSGSYIEDSMHILYVFNELAIRGVVKGNIMLSCSNASGMWKFPMNPEKLKMISAHNGGEGFRHTMAIRWKEMQEADFNLALTDGQLTDGHIDLAQFDSAGIEVTGMYIDRHADKKTLLKYTGGLKEWFHNSIVRNSVDEGVYAIVDSALLNLGTGKVA